MNAALFALSALIPAMIGPLPLPNSDSSISVALCGGGALAIPLSRKKHAPALPHAPKACHAGCTRKRFDSPQ